MNEQLQTAITQAITEIDQAIDGAKQTLQVRWDQQPEWYHGEFQPYRMTDRSGRPILADLLAAKAQLLAALANTPQARRNRIRRAL